METFTRAITNYIILKILLMGVGIANVSTKLGGTNEKDPSILYCSYCLMKKLQNLTSAQIIESLLKQFLQHA